MYETKLYKVWTSMKCRCLNKKDKRYYDYGGRGITVCDEWLEFKSFMDWAYANGYNDGLAIDRIDNDKGYCPENCKWSTTKEQARNKRTTHYIEIDGVAKSMIEWSEISGTRHGTISTRLRRGWNPKEAVFGKNIKAKKGA